MGILCIALIVVFTAVVLLFEFQNLQTATFSPFAAGIALPVFNRATGICVLGTLTGGALYVPLPSSAPGSAGSTVIAAVQSFRRRQPWS